MAHLLQGGTFRGDKPNSLNIKASELTPEVWDYIFFKDASMPKTTISAASLDVSTFNYYRRLFCQFKHQILITVDYFRD